MLLRAALSVTFWLTSMGVARADTREARTIATEVRRTIVLVMARRTCGFEFKGE